MANLGGVHRIVLHRPAVLDRPQRPAHPAPAGEIEGAAGPVGATPAIQVIRNQDLDECRDRDRQQGADRSIELRSGQDRDEYRQWSETNRTTHDARNEDHVLQELENDDEPGDEYGLLPAHCQGDQHGRDTTDPGTQDRDDLGDPGPQPEQRPELDAHDAVTDGRGDADDQAERELAAQPVAHLALGFVPEPVDADLSLRTKLLDDQPPEQRFLHQIVESDREDGQHSDDCATDGRGDIDRRLLLRRRRLFDRVGGAAEEVGAGAIEEGIAALVPFLLQVPDVGR